MINEVLTTEYISSLIINIIPVAISTYMLKESIVIKPSLFFIIYTLISGVFCFPSAFENNVKNTYIYTVLALSYVFLVRENKMNRLSASFLAISVYNVVGNGLIFILFIIIAIVRGNGQWMNLNNEGSGMDILMILFSLVGMVVALVFGKWIKEHVLGFSGKKRILLFIFIPLFCVFGSLLKPLLSVNYAASPSGPRMVIDVILTIDMASCILCVLIDKMRNLKKQNVMIAREREKIQNHYDEVFKEEEKLRMIRHELNNRVIRDDEKWD